MPPKRASTPTNDKSSTAPPAECPFGKKAKSDASEFRAGRSDGPLKCTWYPGTTEPNPHNSVPRFREPAILDNILSHIGNTPLVRINSIAKMAGLRCELLAKCEFFNAGGSVKDRIGKRMIEDAERSGRIKPGDVLIEPTSGNTGIGLALAAAIKGYRMIITLPEKMSQEKVDVLKALGAEIIRTPTEAPWDSPESHIGVAIRLNREIPNSHILDQYTNPSNPMAHYDHTAEELLEACEGRIDMAIISAGTGGTITGIARKLKERCPSCIIVGVDPVGSILAEPDHLNDAHRLESYKVEGIGYDFIPAVLDRSVVDRWVKTSDDESLRMSRRMIREEGLLCGGSCGSAMVAAVAQAAELPAGARAVVILPDSVRNYMTKFLNDNWMFENGFSDAAPRPSSTAGIRATWWTAEPVSSLRLNTPVTITPDVSVRRAIEIMAERGFDNLPVVSTDGGEALGVVTEGTLSAKLLNGRSEPTDPVSKGMYTRFRKIAMDAPLSELAAIFDKDHFALVVSEQRCLGSSPAADFSRTTVVAAVTRLDLSSFISAGARDRRKA